MPTLLRVDASMRTEDSVSRAVADATAAAWEADTADATVVRRDLSASPLPADAWALAISAAYSPEESWNEAQRSARDLATTLADEIIGADVLVLASPLYNFGVSQYAKTWIDLLIAEPRLGPGTTALNGKKAIIVVAQGGGYRAGTPREGWDHATPYLERIFRDNYGMEVETIIADLTLASSTPAMEHLIELAQESLASAHTAAAEHGARLASAGAIAAA